MSLETENILANPAETPQRAAAGVFGSLPVSVVMSQRCAAELRAYLAEANLAHYRIFHSPGHELYDVERAAESLGEVTAWESLSPLIAGGEPIDAMTYDSQSATLWEGGVLRLQKHEAVLARWYWINDGNVQVLWLCAAPSTQRFYELRQKVFASARQKRIRSWQIVRGYANADDPLTPRETPTELFLSESLRQRVEMEVIGFFNEPVAELYRGLGVPYRRGVLLHGPPGNGKTSLIRYIGARVSHVSAMLLRTTAEFDTDDLEEVIRRWTRSAPAILVIEDLNWLLSKVNVSTFLNLLDGVDSNAGAGGLLLIATSNHPEQLDGAINNRPGRFDVVIEMPGPDIELRRAFFLARLPKMPAELIERAASETDRLSFAHLQEVLRLSGLSAIHGGRAERDADDLMEAVRTVCAARDDAVRGFPTKTEIPFGLLPLLERRRQQASAGK